MRKNKAALLFVGMIVSFNVLSEDIRLSNENIDKKMDEFSLYQDYYNAQVKMLNAKQRAEAAMKGKVLAGDETVDDGQPRGDLLSRNRRGQSQYDPTYKEAEKKESPVAYVSSTYGGNELNAEIQWGEMSFIVGKGDPIIGGNWVVESISKGAVVLSGPSGSVRMTGSPVNISKLVGGAR